jgi:hypothetical protein
MIQIEERLSSVVLLVALNFVLVFYGMSAAYGVPGNVTIAQARSGYGSIMVNVANSCTNQPVPGADVNVGGSHYVTNAFGSTTFMVLPAGSITITVSHSGYYRSSLLTASSTYPSVYPSVYTIFLEPLKACYP